MSVKIGTVVEFRENYTRRPLQGTVTDCHDGQVKIKTPDGQKHSRMETRVKPIPLPKLEPAPVMPPLAGTKSGIQSLFESMHDVVVMVAKGHTASAIISGPGGLGKTHTVTETLDEIGLRKDFDYQLVKGYTSARGLYEKLYYNNDKLTVFDDCDSALKDRISASLLKAALDSYSIREISWTVKSSAVNASIPLRFEFTGRIIFLTNKLVHELDEPLLTRSLVVDLQMTREQILEHMEHILPTVKGFSLPDKIRAMEFIRQSAPHIRNLSLRTLVMVLRVMKAHPSRWQKLAGTFLTT
jgi:hypothetical protein